MKKLLTFLLTALLAFGVGWAEPSTATFEVTSSGGGLLSTINKNNPIVSTGGVTLTFNIGTHTSTWPVYNSNGGSVRFYSGNTLTVSCGSSNKVIKSIVFTYNSSYTSNDLSLVSGQSGAYDANNDTWTGSSSSVQFTYAGSSQTRFYRIVVTIDDDNGSTTETCAAPQFSPNGGSSTTGSLDVTITSATEGATIYYTTDNTDPVVNRSSIANGGTVTLTESCTLKAMAVKSGMDNSPIATSQSYTITSGGGTPSGDFQLLTDASQLEIGDQVIFVSSGSVGSAEAMSTVQNTNNRGVTSVNVASGLKVAATDETEVFTLEGSSAGWYFKTHDNKYIYAASGSSNHLKTEDAPDANDNAKATINIDGNSKEATVVFQGTNSRNHLRYNGSNSPHIYSCYSSTSTMAKPFIYYRRLTTDPTLSVSNNNLSISVPYDQNSATATFTVTGANLGNNNVTVSVSGADFSVSPTSLTPDANGVVNAETITVTYNGTSTTPVTGTVTVTFGNLSETVTVTAQKELPPPPTMTATPAAVTFGTLDGGQLTVNANHLDADVNLSMLNAGYTANTDKWTVTPSTIAATNGSEVSSAATVNYSGRLLKSDNTVRVSTTTSGVSNVDVPVHYQHNGPVYIVTSPAWDFTTGAQMNYSNGVYSATVNTAADTYLVFTKKVGNDVDWSTSYLFGPKAEPSYDNPNADWWLSESSLSQNWPLDSTVHHTVKMLAGTYTITLNAATNEMRIVPDVHQPVFSPDPGRYPDAQTVTISCDTPGAHIYYTTDGSTPSASNGTLYTGSIPVSETTTLKAVAIYGGVTSQEAEATYTIKPIGADDFILVTSTNDVTAGDDYVLVYDEAYAMGTTLSSSNGGYYNDVTSGFTVDNNVVSLSDGYTVNVFTLLDAGEGKFFMQSENGNYIGVNGNNLIQSTSTPTADTYKWSITISNNSAVIQNASTNRYLAYNTTSPRYNTYQSITTNSAQQYASLYKRGTTQPRITVDPSSLDFVIPAGESSQSKNATVIETNTTGTTSVSVGGDDASYFTASLNNGTLTVTYNGTASSSDPDVAVVTLTNGTATATVNVTGYKLPLTVTITPASATFSGSTMSGITLESNVAGATLEYRIDGGSWTSYSQAFGVTATSVGQTVIVEARATYNGETATATGTYTRVAKSSTLFEKVTSADQIKAGNKYIIVYEGTPEALNGVTTGGTGVTVEWHGNNVVDKAGTNAIEFTLSGTASEAVLSCDLNGSTYYLEPGSAPGLDLADQSTTGYEWTLTANNGGYVLMWGNYMMRYNSGSSAANGRFRIYDGTTGQPVYLYVQGGTIQAPEITPDSGTYYESKTVTISDESDDVTIWYTTDGSDPATSSTRQQYDPQNKPIAVYTPGTTTTITAVAIDEENNVSEPSTVTYTWGVPTAAIAPGTGNVATDEVTVAITCTPAGATIYYTTDGSVPTSESTQYTAPFTVNLDEVGDAVTVNAIAVYNNTSSAVATATYTRVEKVIDVNAPFFSPLKNQTYYGAQTLMIECTTPNADIHYEIIEVSGTTPPDAAYVNNPTNVSTVYTGPITMTVGNSYYVKAIAYIGEFASTISEGWYVIQPFTGGTNVYQNLKDFNDNCGTGVTATFANPVQVVYHSTYTNNGEFPEFCYVRDNTDYACIYFGKRETGNYTIFEMGDWIDGSQIAGVTNIWDRNFHIQLGTGSHEVTSWPSSAIGWSEILPEEITNATIVAGTAEGSNSWGHYVHLRNTTLRNVQDYDDDDPKHTGLINDGTADAFYYDKFYRWSAGECKYTTGGHTYKDQIHYLGDYDQAFFTGKQENGATFDVYGIVDYYSPYEPPFEICPIDFLWIYKPNIVEPSNDQCSAPFTTTITITTPEWAPNDPDLVIYYKTDKMEDWEVYTPGQPIPISSTTTVMTYAEIPAEKSDGTNYNDYIRSLTDTAVYVFPAVKDPIILPPGETYDANVTSSVEVTVSTNPESSTGTVTLFTTDGTDPRTNGTVLDNNNGTFTVDEDMTVSAVSYIVLNGETIWSNVVSETYQFIENDNKVYDLLKTAPVVGNIYVIVNKADNVGLSNTQNATNRAATGVMFVDNTTKEKVKGNSNLATFVLEAATAGRYYFRDLSSGEYLCVNTNNNPNLVSGARSSYAEATVSVNSSITSGVDESYPATVMMSYDGTRRYLRYYSAGRTFTTYDAATTNQDIFLYGYAPFDLLPPTITPGDQLVQVVTGNEHVDATVATNPTSAQDGAKTVYTTDGSDPRYSATAVEMENDSEIIGFINTNTTVRAASYIEYEGEIIWSDVVKATYTFIGIKEPIITPDGGLYATGTTVEVTVSTNPLNSQEGVTTYYTTDGSDPRTNGTPINGNSTTISVTGNTTVQAASCVVVDGQTLWSIVVSETYQFTQPTPLYLIESTGVENNDYIVADELIGTWAVYDGNTKLLWAKDKEPYVANDLRPGKTNKQGDYVKDLLKYQNDPWDESNWVVLDFSGVSMSPEDFVGQKIKEASIIGKYTDAENFTIKLFQNPAPNGTVSGKNYTGWTENFEPVGGNYDRSYNTFVPANFMAEGDDVNNLNRIDQETGFVVGAVAGENALQGCKGDSLYFVNPKIQEVARIWGVWNDNDEFTIYKVGRDTVDSKVTNINAWDLKGCFHVVWDYNRVDLAHNYHKPNNLVPGEAYEFHAAVMKRVVGNGSKRTQPTPDGTVNPSSNYELYPLDMPEDPVPTAVRELIFDLNLYKTVVGVSYFNLMGQESSQPFEGINIVVTRYSDGSTSAVKVLR